MNISTLARIAYSNVSGPTKTDRGAEYQVFAKITRRLVKSSSMDITSFVELAEAVHDNRRLWTILATEVADNENNLPADLRAQIFYLAEFTEQHSAKVLARQADTSTLIEINTAVMRGLRSLAS